MSIPQLERINDYQLILKKIILECDPKNYKQILSIIKNIPREIFIQIMESSVYEKIMLSLSQVYPILDKDLNLSAISVMTKIFETQIGRAHV